MKKKFVSWKSEEKHNYLLEFTCKMLLVAGME